MKGREAVRAANRRTEEAKAEAEALRAELAKERADRKAEAAELRSECKRLKADHMAEASRLAVEEVSRRLAQVEAERRARGLSDDMVKQSMHTLDRLVKNACRFVSMTHGLDPIDALCSVVTWMTGEDFIGVFDADKFIVEFGFPQDGWVADLARYQRYFMRNDAKRVARGDEDKALNLDRVEREAKIKIHPDYVSEWYSPSELPPL